MLYSTDSSRSRSTGQIPSLPTYRRTFGYHTVSCAQLNLQRADLAHAGNNTAARRECDTFSHRDRWSGSDLEAVRNSRSARVLGRRRVVPTTNAVTSTAKTMVLKSFHSRARATRKLRQHHPAEDIESSCLSDPAQKEHQNDGSVDLRKKVTAGRVATGTQHSENVSEALRLDSGGYGQQKRLTTAEPVTGKRAVREPHSLQASHPVHPQQRRSNSIGEEKRANGSVRGSSAAKEQRLTTGSSGQQRECHLNQSLRRKRCEILDQEEPMTR